MYVLLKDDDSLVNLCIKKNIEYKKVNTVDEMRDTVEDNDVVMVLRLVELGGKAQNITDNLEFFKNKSCRVVVAEIASTRNKENNTEKVNIIIETLKAMQTSKLGLAGRPRRMTPEDFKRLYEKVRTNKLTPGQFMKEYDLPAGTYYRYKKMYIDGEE